MDAGSIFFKFHSRSISSTLRCRLGRTQTLLVKPPLLLCFLLPLGRQVDLLRLDLLIIFVSEIRGTKMKDIPLILIALVEKVRGSEESRGTLRGLSRYRYQYCTGMISALSTSRRPPHKPAMTTLETTTTKTSTSHKPVKQEKAAGWYCR